MYCPGLQAADRVGQEFVASAGRYCKSDACRCAAKLATNPCDVECQHRLLHATLKSRTARIVHTDTNTLLRDSVLPEAGTGGIVHTYLDVCVLVLQE
jgi:hypothetical protein